MTPSSTSNRAAAGAGPGTLVDLSRALVRRLDNPTLFTCVNARIILQTGVNLRDVPAEQNADPALVRQVTQALHAMGFEFSGKEAP